MIHYHLICSDHHTFDQWFDNMADYEAKRDAEAIICPVCGDTHVSKALMAPSLTGSGGTVGSTPDPVAPCGMEGGCGTGSCGCAALDG